MPEELVSRGFSLREEREEDTPFLLALYASTRAEELAPVPWSDEEKQTFLTQQFGAQRFHYRTHLVGCVFLVLERRGEPVGRLYLQELKSNLHIVDIALTPETRGQGIGGMLIAQVIAEATALGKGVGLFVEAHNPARRLYERLGFVALNDDPIHMEMERRFNVQC